MLYILFENVFSVYCSIVGKCCFAAPIGGMVYVNHQRKQYKSYNLKTLNIGLIKYSYEKL